MIPEPSICAIMLTRDRPEMARQAVECFRSQTYQNKRLLIYDTSESEEMFEDYSDDESISLLESNAIDHHRNPKTVGYLRNRANRAAFDREPDILIHWDDDDYSHPNRIAEQVALLQSSGADCVGYNEMLFWRADRQLTNADVYGLHECLRSGIEPRCGCDVVPGEAWLYSNPNQSYVLGTSMAYWRKAWEARPFEATSQGEDVRWSAGVRCVGCQSFWPRAEVGAIAHGSDSEPRMIARIHAGNTSNAYRPETMARASEWRRVSEWDQHCRSVFA